MQTLGPPRFEPATTLLCPLCTGAFLHSTYVVVYDRHQGGLKTFETTIDHVEMSRSAVDSEVSDNPSEKRHGLAVGFYCEDCGEDEEFELTFAQHNGQTLVQWRKP